MRSLVGTPRGTLRNGATTTPTAKKIAMHTIAAVILPFVKRAGGCPFKYKNMLKYPANQKVTCATSTVLPAPYRERISPGTRVANARAFMRTDLAVAKS